VSDAGVIKKIAMSVWAAATITLTNKSIDLGTNTLTGSVAEFNAALQSESFATLGGTEVLVAKTLTTPTISSTGWTNALHAHAANNSGGTLDASVLGAGTVPDGRFPSTLPALNGSALTNLSSGNLTGALPAIDGSNLTNLPASGATLSGSTNNTIVTVTGSSAMIGEANLLFDGTLLRIGSAASSTAASFLEITGTMPTHGSIGHVVIQSTDSMAADKGGELLMGGVYTGSSRAAFGGIGAFKENSSDGNYAGYLSLYSRTHGSTVAASEGIRINSVGAVTMPAQPSFCVRFYAGESNVTGQGYFAKVKFDTDSGAGLHDIGGNFNTSNNTFVAPVGGRYLFTTFVRFSGVTTSALSASIRIDTSDALFDRHVVIDRDQGEAQSASIAVVVDMDANDEALIKFALQGESGNVTDINGSSSAQTVFTGVLLA